MAQFPKTVTVEVEINVPSFPEGAMFRVKDGVLTPLPTGDYYRYDPHNSVPYGESQLAQLVEGKALRRVV